jgi:hypothetical protein
MNTDDQDRLKAIEYKHKLADRLLELTRDFRKLDKKILLGIPTDDLIELGKAMVQPYKILEELKEKKPTLRDALAKESLSKDKGK